MLALLLLDAAALGALERWPAHLPLQLLLYIGAGMAWLAAAYRPRAWRRSLLVPALALHVVALASPPRHSDDYHRYLWDGLVQRAGINPYAHPPEDEALAPLRNGDFDAMNNRQLPTIYPPGAQLGFRVAAELPCAPLVAWKLVVALGDLLTALLLFRRAPTCALLWLTCPLVLIELCVNAHVEAVGLLPFVAALLLLESRPRVAGVCLGLATAVKVLPVFLFPFLRRRQALVLGALALLLVSAPYLSTRMVGSLGEYGRRWRSNDGVFALVLRATTYAIRPLGLREPTDRIELGRVAPLLTGRDRPQVYPDELAGVLARGIVLIAFVVVLVRNRRRPPIALARVGVGTFLLLTPSLHPWYALWLVPPLLLDFGGCPRERLAWLWLVAWVPIGHVPLMGHLAGRPWHDPVWARLLEHAPPLLLLAQLPRLRGVVYSRCRCSAHVAEGEG